MCAQSCPTLCDPTDRNAPGFPLLHHLPELTQTHVHQVSDATQPSHPLSSPSPAFNLPPTAGQTQHNQVLSVASKLHAQFSPKSSPSPPPSTRSGYLLLTLQVRTWMWFHPRALRAMPVQTLDYSSALLEYPGAEVSMGLPANSTQQKVLKTQGPYHYTY